MRKNKLRAIRQAIHRLDILVPTVSAVSLVRAQSPPLNALPANGERRREEGWAMVVCLPIAQSSWVMTQPAASGPAKYISSAGLDHTASP